MAVTNFSALTTEQKTVWEREVWKQGRNANFFSKFFGGSSAMIHRVDELTRDERGTRAVMTLVADLQGDGVAGDNELEGNEEAIRAFDKVINIDQMRHANKSKGRLAEQSSVVNFRQQSRDVLAHWIGDRLTQQMFLLLAGEALTLNNDGTTRTGSQFAQLAYAAAATPTTNRHFTWDRSTGLLDAGAVATVTSDDYPTWDMLISAKAKAQEQLVKPIRMDGDMAGTEVYQCFLTPNAMKYLKQDANFLANLREAMPRTPNHPLFRGANTYFVDGLILNVHNHVYHATTWGGGAVPGSTFLMCGAQALGFADIGMGEWEEKTFDYNAKPGIAYSKICGLLKPQFYSDASGQDEDFGVIRINVYNG